MYDSSAHEYLPWQTQDAQFLARYCEPLDLDLMVLVFASLNVDAHRFPLHAVVHSL